MIKRTLYFGNPAYLSTRDNQLVIERRLGEEEEAEAISFVPIEDIGTIMLDHPTITITQPDILTFAATIKARKTI